MTLKLTPPEAQMYIDRYKGRSIRPIVPYHWHLDKPLEEYGDDEDYEITEVKYEDLDFFYYMGEHDFILVDEAIYVQGNTDRRTGNARVLIMTHEQGTEPEVPWVTTLLFGLNDNDQIENLIKQIRMHAEPTV